MLPSSLKTWHITIYPGVADNITQWTAFTGPSLNFYRLCTIIQKDKNTSTRSHNYIFWKISFLRWLLFQFHLVFIQYFKCNYEQECIPVGCVQLALYRRRRGVSVREIPPEGTWDQRQQGFPFLPAATKLWPRLCFYSCLWFCPRGGGSASRRPPLPRRHPPAKETSPWKEAPPCQGDPLGGGTPLPRRPPLEGGPPAYGQWAASMHPTGMHSCFIPSNSLTFPWFPKIFPEFLLVFTKTF